MAQEGSFTFREESPTPPAPVKQEPEIQKPDFKGLIPEEKQSEAYRLDKNQAYYDEMEVNMQDIDTMEQRVEELERYLGIEGINNVDYFVKNEIETLDTKCNRLDDFIKVIEDRNFLLNDLYTKYDQLENFMKDGNKF